MEWSLSAIALMANGFADLSSNEHLVVLLTAFGNLAMLAAVICGQTGSRLYAQSQVGKLFARHRPSSSPVWLDAGLTGSLMQ